MLQEPTIHYPLSEVETSNGRVGINLVIRVSDCRPTLVMHTEDDDEGRSIMAVMSDEEWRNFTWAVKNAIDKMTDMRQKGQISRLKGIDA